MLGGRLLGSIVGSLLGKPVAGQTYTLSADVGVFHVEPQNVELVGPSPVPVPGPGGAVWEPPMPRHPLSKKARKALKRQEREEWLAANAVSVELTVVGVTGAVEIEMEVPLPVSVVITAGSPASQVRLRMEVEDWMSWEEEEEAVALALLMLA